MNRHNLEINTTLPGCPTLQAGSLSSAIAYYGQNHGVSAVPQCCRCRLYVAARRALPAPPANPSGYMHDLPAIFNINLSAAQLRAGPQDGKGAQKGVKILWSGSARKGLGVK